MFLTGAHTVKSGFIQLSESSGDLECNKITRVDSVESVTVNMEVIYSDICDIWLRRVLKKKTMNFHPYRWRGSSDS